MSKWDMLFPYKEFQGSLLSFVANPQKINTALPGERKMNIQLTIYVYNGLPNKQLVHNVEYLEINSTCHVILNLYIYLIIYSVHRGRRE